MNFDKQGMLVVRLHKATSEGKLDWKPGGNENQFQVSFPNYTVILTRDTQGEDYFVSIINDLGELTEAFSDVDLSSGASFALDQPTGSWVQTMREIYTMARRTALGVDKALDAILKNLSD